MTEPQVSLRKDTETETFFLRFEGGPLDGKTLVAPPDLSWPMPEGFEAPDGTRYRKVSESQLPPNMPHIVRGAQYRVEPTNE